MVYRTRRNKKAKKAHDKDVKRQMWKNNLLGIVAIILFLIALFDIGGVISSITELLIP